jgi:hypothetical protein
MAQQKETTGKSSYFQQRMQLLGITDEINKITIKTNSNEIVENEDGTRQRKEFDEETVPIFRQHELGIEILVYTLNRERISFKPEDGAGNKQRWSKFFSLLRYEKPIVDKNGREMKYKIPKGGGSYPFFPPQLIQKFEDKTPMKTVFITEGYFKAFKAAMHGVDIIGLSSITHMKDKATGALHADIVALIKSGLVERFVWLTDGDCLDITQKEITEDKDLRTRPYGFYSSISTFKNLFDDYTDIETWFMHINTDAILADNKKLTRDQVKGLDDLLITCADKADEVVKEMYSFSKSGYYFYRQNISHGTGKLWRYFHLNDVNDFFNFHVDRRPELKDKEFKFNGTQYKFNDETKLCDVRLPGESRLYFRVGDYYYKFIEKPNQYKQIERVFEERKKTTIVDDHGKNFTKHIPKYEAFCNVPDHNNFQQVIHNCFNVYSPLDYEPDEDKCTTDDFPAIYSVIRHIWGTKKASFKNKDTNEVHEYENWQLGMDYLQLLYTNPSQKLPILCLVSKDNNTGKSTLGFFLRQMLGANVAIVGNADLANDFNAHWATKSVVVCDETKIDKHSVIEKIKNFSTAKKIFMNAKGKGQVELDCFIKFILITNNEETFITATEEDTRYWVLKVPVLQKDDPKMLDRIVEEIPAFLSYLRDRKLVTDLRSRMWFHYDLIKTDALRRVIAYSAPTIIKEIRQGLKELFLDTGLEEIKMTAEVVMKELLSRKNYERSYVHNILQDRMNVRQYHVFRVEGRDKTYNTEAEAIAAAEIAFPDHAGHMIFSKIKTISKVIRYDYPTYIEKFENGIKERVRMEAKDCGRPYVFYRKDFITEEESNQVELQEEQNYINQMTPELMKMEDDSELPFPPM